MPRGTTGGKMVELAKAVDDTETELRNARDRLSWAERRLKEAREEVPIKEQAYAAAKKALRDALPKDPDVDEHSAFAEEDVEPLDDMIRNNS